MANCYFGFGHILKAPVVAASSSVEFPWMGSFTGNDDNLAYVPNPFSQNFDKTKFLDRLSNFISYHWASYQFHSKSGESQTQIMRKYLSPGIPHLRDIEKNIALTLVNRHPVMYGTKPLIPSLIEVSGIHIEENVTLPQVCYKKINHWLQVRNVYYLHI